MLSTTNLELTHLIIFGAYAVQALELLLFPVQSEFTTYGILRRHRQENSVGLISQMMNRALLAALAAGTIISVGTFLLPLGLILVPEMYQQLVPIPHLHTPIAALAANCAIILGSCLTGIAVLQFHAMNSPRRSLITSGVFGFCRNPISVGLMAMVAGFFLAFPSWIGLFGTGVYMLNTHVRIRMEEHFLEQHFGAEYHRYKRYTGRYLPVTAGRISDGNLFQDSRE
ncbi:MAG TPA: isoprenylcysteine carboxylmethyltransferase family protein [bacterium]|nr:isoprenylcysteine carboxylmethyltransferase family protein [bacterium]